MPKIVSYKTKKAFKEACKDSPKEVYITDPSWFSPESGILTNLKNFPITVTNHPKRSWFASVEKLGDNKFRVS